MYIRFAASPGWCPRDRGHPALVEESRMPAMSANPPSIRGTGGYVRFAAFPGRCLWDRGRPAFVEKGRTPATSANPPSSRGTGVSVRFAASPGRCPRDQGHPAGCLVESSRGRYAGCLHSRDLPDRICGIPGIETGPYSRTRASVFGLRVCEENWSENPWIPACAGMTRSAQAAVASGVQAYADGGSRWIPACAAAVDGFPLPRE